MIVDLKGRRALGKWKLEAPDGRLIAHAVAISGDGKTVVVGFEAPGESNGFYASEVRAYSLDNYTDTEPRFPTAEPRHVATIALAHPAIDIAVSRDGGLLYAAGVRSRTLAVYDAVTGDLLHTFEDLGEAPSQIIVP